MTISKYAYDDDHVVFKFDDLTAGRRESRARYTSVRLINLSRSDLREGLTYT